MMILYIGGIMIFNSFGESKETKFWKWFLDNESLLFNFEEDQENVFKKLNKELSRLNEDLTFEFGPKEENGTREFVISAGGVKKSFPSVERLYSAAPQLRLFKIIKFRPRRDVEGKMEFGGITVSSEDVTYQLFIDEDKIDIAVFQ